MAELTKLKAPSKVIDFRVRPPVAGFEKAVMYGDPQRTAKMGAAFGFSEPSPSLLQASLQLFEEELDASGIDLAVIPGRIGAPAVGPTENEQLIAYATETAGRACVFAAVDPAEPDWEVQLKKHLSNGTIVNGVALEPGLLNDPVYPDDALCLPVYQFCQDRELPIILSAGGNVGPDCGYTLPVYFDRVARDFPQLNIVIAHGGWPWILPTLHVAFRRENLFVSPDMYMFMPANDAYLEAMNSYLSERFIFASSYPFVPLSAYLQRFLQVARDDVVAKRVLFQNAATLLKL